MERTPRLPNFFLAGVSKAGTTSLYQYLRQHPQVYMSPVKEPMFFGAADLLSEPYRQHVLRQVERDRRALRQYLACAQRPGASYLVLEWQDYVALFRNVQDELAIGDVGRYATHLQRFFELFPREQIRIHLYDDYRADPHAVLSDIFAFLGVAPDHPIDVSRRYNETLVLRFPVLHALRRRMFGATSPVHWLPERARRAVRRLSNRRGAIMVMNSADRQMVVEYYRDEILRTADLIGRDLSAWLR